MTRKSFSHTIVCFGFLLVIVACSGSNIPGGGQSTSGGADQSGSGGSGGSGEEGTDSSIELTSDQAALAAHVISLAVKESFLTVSSPIVKAVANNQPVQSNSTFSNATGTYSGLCGTQYCGSCDYTISGSYQISGSDITYSNVTAEIVCNNYRYPSINSEIVSGKVSYTMPSGGFHEAPDGTIWNGNYQIKTSSLSLSLDGNNFSDVSVDYLLQHKRLSGIGGDSYQEDGTIGGTAISDTFIPAP